MSNLMQVFSLTQVVKDCTHYSLSGHGTILPILTEPVRKLKKLIGMHCWKVKTFWMNWKNRFHEIMYGCIPSSTSAIGSMMAEQYTCKRHEETKCTSSSRGLNS